jgi:cardiolipin synthase A/B
VKTAMKSSRQRTTDTLTTRLWRYLSPRRALLTIVRAALILQVITLVALEVIAMLRERSMKRMKKKPFPYPSLDEVRVGKNRVQLYASGKELYPAMLDAIEGARECIYLESYIWKDDEIGAEVKKRLIQKAEQGIAVYVIFDGFGNLVVPHSFKVFPPSVHALEYVPIKRPWHIFDPRRYALDHRKLLIVDGHIGFIGGYNLGVAFATEWRDTHLRIDGPAAADLAHTFIDFWNRSSPRDEIERHYRRHFDPLITLRGNDASRLTFPIRDMYIDAIDQAEHHIMLSNAYFVPDRSLLGALKEAHKRGVDVRIVVPWASNHIVVEWLSRGYFTECLRAGIRVFGYDHTMLHAKTCTIDGQWSTVGTANLDRLSSLGNYEINVEIYSADVAHQMEKIFAFDTTDAVELTLDYWTNRPWYAKFGESMIAPFRYLL